MTSNELETALRSMVRRYGFVEVDRCLKEIGFSEDQPRYSGLSGGLHDTGVPHETYEP